MTANSLPDGDKQLAAIAKVTSVIHGQLTKHWHGEQACGNVYDGGAHFSLNMPQYRRPPPGSVAGLGFFVLIAMRFERT
jgi:hypothetical protein